VEITFGYPDVASGRKVYRGYLRNQMDRISTSYSAAMVQFRYRNDRGFLRLVLGPGESNEPYSCIRSNFRFALSSNGNLIAISTQRNSALRRKSAKRVSHSKGSGSWVHCIAFTGRQVHAANRRTPLHPDWKHYSYKCMQN